MRSRSARLAIPTAVLVTAALALTACSHHNSASDAAATSPASTTTASSPAPSQPSTAPVDPVTSASAGSGTTSAAPTSTAGGTTVQSQSGPGSSAVLPCSSSQLKVSLADRGVGAGQFYAKIVFTNTASTACTLTGYPGVSYVKAAGVQSGNAAARTGEAIHTVTLPAHGSASAMMHDVNGVGGYSPGQCQLTSVEGLRVYPPNRTAALFLPWKTEHCAGSGIHSFTIAPVR